MNRMEITDATRDPKTHGLRGASEYRKGGCAAGS
jgi:hypothetical protein